MLKPSPRFKRRYFMKIDPHILPLEGCTVVVYAPRTNEPLPVVYMNVSRPEDIHSYLPKLASAMGKTIRPAHLVCVTPTDWNRDFSPWEAAGLHEGSAPFSGHADERIALLCDRVKPLIDAQFPTLPDAESTMIFGYSLGGLAALYALYECPDVFGAAGCLSGSLWYEGFMDYQRQNVGKLHDQRIYLSLGRKEEKTRHPLMCRIGLCYEETLQMLSAQLGEENVTFTLHNGGHGTEVDQRMLQGLTWLLRLSEAN